MDCLPRSAKLLPDVVDVVEAVGVPKLVEPKGFVADDGVDPKLVEPNAGAADACEEPNNPPVDGAVADGVVLLAKDAKLCC